MNRQLQYNENSNKFVLKNNKMYLFHIAGGFICFLILCVLWIIKGSEYSGFVKVVTIFIGFFSWLGIVLRIFVSPLSIVIENEKLLVKRFGGVEGYYNLSEFMEVSYSFWFSILVSRSGWLRFGADLNKGIFISDLFFENLGPFLDHLEKHGIKVDRRLVK